MNIKLCEVTIQNADIWTYGPPPHGKFGNKDASHVTETEGRRLAGWLSILLILIPSLSVAQ